VFVKFHGITLADQGFIEKLRIENLDADPTLAAAGRIWYNSTERKVKYSEYDNSNNLIAKSVADEAELLQAISDFNESSRTVIQQSAHGFTALTPLRYDETLAQWVGASASSEATTAVALVREVISADSFEIVQIGQVTVTGHGLTVGDYYFLSETAGQLTSVSPEISQPILYVRDVDNVLILPYRPHIYPDPNLHQLVWKDLVASLGNAKSTGGAAPEWAQIDGSVFYGHLFTKSKVAELQAVMHFNHDYALGTDIYPHVHWMPTTTAGGVVRFVISASYAKGHQQAAFNMASPVQVIIEQTVTTGALMHHVAEGILTAFTTVLEPDGIIYLHVIRDINHVNDTYPDTLILFNMDIHYQANMIGTINKSPNFYG